MTANEIKKKIDVLFSDTSRPASATRADIADIADRCEMLLETLPEDESD